MYYSKRGTSAEQKVLDRVKVESNGCWVWTGSTISDGYGMVRLPGSRLNRLVHRVIYEYVNGPIPSGLIVRHKCDNPPCVNPEHLEIGTDKDNAQDRSERGRWRGGSGRFTPETISEIKERYYSGRETQSELGLVFGVSQVMIGKIVRGEAYLYESKDLDRGEEVLS